MILKAVFKHIPRFAVVFVLFISAFIRPMDSVAKELSLIRDVEIENTIRSYSAPLFRAAGLDPSAVNIYLIKDNTLNAFVAGGQKLFINTGLLMKSKHAGEVIGVIAHETGHIAGGHLSRLHNAMKDTSAQSILALVLGGAAAAVSGRADVGSVVAMGGQGVGQRDFLKYSRTQESSADQAALRLLDATNQSPRGLGEFMGTLSGQELLSDKRQDPYLLTHPLTEDRLKALQDGIAKSPNIDKPIDPLFEEMHRRMLAKLQGFLDPLATTLRRYKESDDSLESRYARAVAYYRVPDLDKALPLVDGLIAERPDDPYFYELKGQMLFENGRIAEALEPYEKSVRLMPRSAILRVGLARAQMESNDPALLDPAIINLRAAVQQEQDDSFTWRQLAIAHGRKGEMGPSSLAMAEEALLTGRNADAVFHAGRAETLLPRGSIGWLQAQDILAETKKNEKPNK
ncbi:MAG: hypothetical protein A3G18_03920 [Rhodospirillales bacterium RIFCSPLOWO2_12_FULL_58_28]|nr:MAG: hypothetical protein A3H92_04800 [Rhodospirillales bacterium RIFCSPLOWO2_02_FULL_58_16]OHC78675.1 MAG: hypothetical protein A3G18_03920 [Rhodospirillales bacterium RIFCSPLOWO2_12_FULL_58_28]